MHACDEGRRVHMPWSARSAKARAGRTTDRRYCCRSWMGGMGSWAGWMDGCLQPLVSLFPAGLACPSNPACRCLPPAPPRAPAAAGAAGSASIPSTQEATAAMATNAAIPTTTIASPRGRRRTEYPTWPACRPSSSSGASTRNRGGWATSSWRRVPKVLLRMRMMRMRGH